MLSDLHPCFNVDLLKQWLVFPLTSRGCFYGQLLTLWTPEPAPQIPATLLCRCFSLVTVPWCLAPVASVSRPLMSSSDA